MTGSRPTWMAMARRIHHRAAPRGFGAGFPPLARAVLFYAQDESLDVVLLRVHVTIESTPADVLARCGPPFP